MKITKTVGQCICCKIDTDVSNWGFGTLKNGENPVVDIYRKTVNDDGLSYIISLTVKNGKIR